MNNEDEYFIKRYEELLDKGYCDCNEMNCIDNNSPRRILNIVKDLRKQLEAYENMRKEALKYKNEIKKILDKLNSSQWEKDEEEISYKILFSEEFYKLLNYINDLLNILNKVGEDNE